jgi:hypothetical protein
VGEAEKLYSAARQSGKSVIGSAIQAGGELEHEATVQQNAQAFGQGISKNAPLLIGVGVVVLVILFARRGR